MCQSSQHSKITNSGKIAKKLKYQMCTYLILLCKSISTYVIEKKKTIKKFDALTCHRNVRFLCFFFHTILFVSWIIKNVIANFRILENFPEKSQLFFYASSRITIRRNTLALAIYNIERFCFFMPLIEQ